MAPQKNNVFATLIEILKWGVVLWLMWPLLSFQTDKMTLWRMVAGVSLVVIFIGKLFYDFILDNFKKRKEKYTIVDLLILVGFIAGIAVIIGGGMLVLGLYFMGQLQETGAQ